MEPYAVSLRIEAVDDIRDLNRREREGIYRFIRSLADNPFQPTDYTEQDSQGRPREIKIVAALAVVYHVDHADREVRVLDVRPAG